MKKTLSILSLIAILGLTTPAFASPHGGPHGGGPHGGPHHKAHGVHHIRAGHHHGYHIRPHGGLTIHTGYPRHGYWGGFRNGYWRTPYCDYRLGWCEPYYSPYVAPFTGTSFSIRF